VRHDLTGVLQNNGESLSFLPGTTRWWQRMLCVNESNWVASSGLFRVAIESPVTRVDEISKGVLNESPVVIRQSTA